jgi:hypothetical protein
VCKLTALHCIQMPINFLWNNKINDICWKEQKLPYT